MIAQVTKRCVSNNKIQGPCREQCIHLGEKKLTASQIFNFIFSLFLSQSLSPHSSLTVTAYSMRNKKNLEKHEAVPTLSISVSVTLEFSVNVCYCHQKSTSTVDTSIHGRTLCSHAPCGGSLDDDTFGSLFRESQLILLFSQCITEPRRFMKPLRTVPVPPSWFGVMFGSYALCQPDFICLVWGVRKVKRRQVFTTSYWAVVTL